MESEGSGRGRGRGRGRAKALADVFQKYLDEENAKKIALQSGQGQGPSSSSASIDPNPTGQPSGLSQLDLLEREKARNAAAAQQSEEARARSALSTPQVVAGLTFDRCQVFPLGPGRGRGRGSIARAAALAAAEPPTASSDIKDDLAELEKRVVVKKGVKGQTVPVTCNHIRLGRTGNTGLFEYDVEFKPPVDSRKVSRLLLESKSDLLGTVMSFDGTRLYLPFRLADNEYELSAEHPYNSSISTNFKIRYARENKMEDCVYFYNVLFRQIMQILGLVEMKRNFYDHTATHLITHQKLEIWPGYITAVDEYEGGLMLLCDSSFRVLRMDSMHDVLNGFKEAQRTRDRSDFNLSQEMYPSCVKKRFEAYAIGQIVLTQYNRRNYRVDDVDWTQTPKSTFPGKNGQISYEQYYIDKHGVKIKNMCPPLLVTRAKARSGRTQLSTDIIYLIPELCFLTGMTQELTSNFAIMRDVARFTRIDPQQRNIRLKQFVKNVKTNPRASNLLKGWGLDLEDGGVDLEARRMDIPRIAFGPRQGQEIVGSADFGSKLNNKPCYTPIKVRQFAVFCTSQDERNGRKFLTHFARSCTNIGMYMETQGKLVVVNTGMYRAQYLDAFSTSINQNLDRGLQFIVVICPRAQDDLYAVVKKICCIQKPIPSQVVLSKNIYDDKKFTTIMSKIAMQINCKLGGALWTIRIPLMIKNTNIPEKIMFVGMDVYHDTKKKSQSVVGLVASMNPIYTKYFSRIAFQTPGEEKINELREMFRSALIAFYEESNGWPDRIIVFRDGVGDGQLKMTRDYEVVQMTEVIAELCQPKLPVFTFVIVQKRVHTKIFERDASGMINPGAGTVLDHTVTRRYHYDFFLVSQQFRQGTVNPTHYIVLHENEETRPDVIQKFAFVTSFMYYNWAGSICVPAMCQYAHKIAFLVGKHLREEPSTQLNKQLFYL